VDDLGAENRPNRKPVDSRSRRATDRGTLGFMDKTPFRPTIRTQVDLEAAWRQLMGPFGFSGHSLWMMVIEPTGQPVPHLAQIEDTERPPSEAEERGFADFLRGLADEVLEPGSRIAFLLSRPGSDGAAQRDRAWAARLYGACRIAGLPCEIVHLANDAVLLPLPMDELDTSVSA
jgi:hypothetical protein